MLFVFFDSVNTRGECTANDSRLSGAGIFAAFLAVVLLLAIWTRAASAQGAQNGGGLFIVPEFEALLDRPAAGLPVLGIVPFDYRFTSVGLGCAELVEKNLSVPARGRLRVASPVDTAYELADARVAEKMRYKNRRKLPLAKLAGFDYLLLGSVREFDMSEKRTVLGPIDVPFIPSAAEASVRFDFALVRIADGAVLMEKSVSASGMLFDFKVPRQSTWKAYLDFHSPDFIKHPIGAPSLQAASETASGVISIFPLYGRIANVTGATAVVDFENSSPYAAGDTVEVYFARNRMDLLGDNIWTDAENRGTLLVIEVRGARAMCQVLRGHGEIAEGMKVGSLGTG